MENKLIIVKKLEDLINSTRQGNVELTYCDKSDISLELVEVTRVQFIPVLNTGNYKVIRTHLGYVDVSGDNGVELCITVLNSQFFHKE